MSNTILNVDDHEINRYIRTRTLMQAGYRVVEASTGRDAIAKWILEKPPLVLLDVNLPDMPGIEVCRRIKSHPSIRTLVVHVSATFVETSDQASGLKSGADGYLTEPVDPELLVATVGSFLRLREAETRLQDSQERLTQAQTIAGLRFWEWDIVGNMVLLSGTEPHERREVSFTEWLAAIHQPDREFVENALREASTGRESFHYEFRVDDADGDLRWVATKGRIFYDGSGNPARAMGTDMDVTDRKRMELALKRSNEDLSQFAFMISHDLREPLRTITSLTELLSVKHARAFEDNQEAVACLSHVVEAGRRMNSMIMELLSFCQVQESEGQPAAEVSLEDVLNGVIANIKVALEESGGAITHDPLPTVAGDRGQLAEVFQNLIGNSLKYRKKDEPLRIHISSGRGKNEWILSVTDNGIGFDPKYSEEIFGMFKRLHQQETPGSGIGLAVVKKIVERHGGRIWAESRPGEGSRFTFTLPDGR